MRWACKAAATKQERLSLVLNRVLPTWHSNDHAALKLKGRYYMYCKVGLFHVGALCSAAINAFTRTRGNTRIAAPI